jgi:hypothetical protein
MCEMSASTTCTRTTRSSEEPRGLQHVLHVGQGRAHLLGNRPVAALAGLRIDRDHAREEDVVADADAGNVRQVKMGFV